MPSRRGRKHNNLMRLLQRRKWTNAAAQQSVLSLWRMSVDIKDGDVLVQRGEVFLFPERNVPGHIDIDGKMIQVPAVLFAFWQEFREPAPYGSAKQGFEQTGIKPELFDECLNALLDAELITVTEG